MADTIYLRYNPTTQRREFTGAIQESCWYYPQWEHDDAPGWSLRPEAIRGDEVLALVKAGKYNDHSVYRFVPDTSRESRVAEAKERLASLPRRAVPATETELVALIRAKAISTPLEVEATYKSTPLRAVIEPNGTVTYGSRSYKSLSAAASAAIASVCGKPLPANGFTWWKQRVAGKLTALPRAKS